MKILITGKDGQVGHYLSKQLTGKVNLVALGRSELDITDRKAVFLTVSKFRPDYLINAAAYTAVDMAEQEQEIAYQVNCSGPKHLAEAASAVNAVFLHISTDYVFDGEGDSPYQESTPTAPQSIYGQTKRAGEIAVSSKCHKHLILRTAWVFGTHGNNFVKTMLRLGKEHKKLRIVNDQYGGPTYAGDIAKAMIAMITYCEAGTEPEWGTYHFSGTPHVTWFDFADIIFDVAIEQQVLTQKPELTAISTAEYPTPAKRPANSRLDCTKFENQFGTISSEWPFALKQLTRYMIGTER